MQIIVAPDVEPNIREGGGVALLLAILEPDEARAFRRVARRTQQRPAVLLRERLQALLDRAINTPLEKEKEMRAL